MGGKADSPKNEILKAHFSELNQRAMRDMLSGLLSRGAMELYINDKLQSMSEGENCAFFVVDLDYFKQINDTLGHLVGDQAIGKVGGKLSGLFRGSDIVGRLGGDEFAAFISGHISEDTVRQKAASICEQLHMAVGEEVMLELTASVGVCLSKGKQDFKKLYQEADRALYIAKKEGKGRYCICNLEDAGKDASSDDLKSVHAVSFNRLLEQMDSGVALLEMGEVPGIISASKSLFRNLKIEEKSIRLPIPLTDIIHPDDIGSLLKVLKEGLKTGNAVEHTHRIRGSRDKDWSWWHIRASSMEFDGPYPVMLITTNNISDFREKESALKKEVDILRTALEQTSKQMWEVELSTGEFKAFGRNGRIKILKDEKLTFPEGLIDNGFIHPNSVPLFRSFAEKLLNGSTQGFGNFIILSTNSGNYSWASVSYRMLYDDVGRALRAVGVMEKLPQSFEGLISWFSENYKLPGMLVEDMALRMRANLDLDTVEVLWKDGNDISQKGFGRHASEILNEEREKAYYKENAGNEIKYFDREKLLKYFRSGGRWLHAEYRRAASDGSIGSVRTVFFLTEDPNNYQVYLFMYVVRLDRDHTQEDTIYGKISRDETTRLYDRASISRIAGSLFSGRENTNRAVAVLKINGYLNDINESDPEYARTSYAIASAATMAFGGRCVLGQYSPDRIVIVFPQVQEKKYLQRSLNEGLEFMRKLLTLEAPERPLRFIMGVHILPAKTAVYQFMLEQAVQACIMWHDSEVDMVAFAEENDETQLYRYLFEGQEDIMAVEQPETEHSLKDWEKDLILECMSAMLTASDLDETMNGMFRRIGKCFNADRVYSLMLVEGRNCVLMTYEWTDAARHSIKQVVSGVRLDFFPALKRCLAERAVVSLNQNVPVRGQKKRDGTLWRFTVVPLIKNREVDGFLCIENAKRHTNEMALFNILVPFIVQQRERFNEAKRTVSMAERISGIADLREYNRIVPALTSEHYISMGVVCLDIPEFAEINGRYGFEYGSRMQWYIVQTLKDLFGPDLLFRTWEAEFVIFHPNVIREEFMNRCQRLSAIIQRRYPDQVRIGYAWDRGKFYGRRLTSLARAMKKTELTGALTDAEPVIAQMEEYENLAEAMEAGRFLIYFQPKIDMRDASIAGAEALLRVVADDGSVILPSGFIEMLEKNGTIRDMDLFVLEQAVSIMETWQSRGLPAVPVSVNFSRVTMLHPSTLSSVLAILSRYPGFKPEMLEIEITERGAGTDFSGFREVAQKFREYGIRLSLDDFGSQYANLSLFASERFDTVKLDKSLVAGIFKTEVNRTLIRDIVNICRKYDMACVAEGVETREQVEALLEAGCNFAQGFYYDAPMQVMEFRLKYLGGVAEKLPPKTERNWNKE